MRDKILDEMSHFDSDEAKLDAALKVMTDDNNWKFELMLEKAISRAIGVGKGYYAPTEFDAENATDAAVDVLKSLSTQRKAEYG